MGDYRPIAALSDATLLDRARAGEGTCFEALFRRHHRAVLAFLRHRVAEPELAADLLGETFAALLVVVRDRDEAIPPVPLAWLLTTARHLVIDSYRRGVVEDAARRRLAMQPVSLADRISSGLRRSRRRRVCSKCLPHSSRRTSWRRCVGG